MKQKLNIAIFYDGYSTHISAVYEHLSAFHKFSSHHVRYFHACGSIRDFQAKAFDVVVVHYSARVVYPLFSAKITQATCEFRGVKILFLQDEYDLTEKARSFIEKSEIDIVYTCVPANNIVKVYPPSRFPKTRFINVLTAFPGSYTSEWRRPSISERPIHIGYRGTKLPFWYGDLGQEKYQIAVGVTKYAKNRNFVIDIECDNDKRIYGNQWHVFLRNCRCVLGTESGSNVFDEDGSLRDKVNQLIKNNPSISYPDIKTHIFGDAEEPKIMNQISPRIFEAIENGSALILFEGDYSGVVEPDKHYIALKKDFSNIQNVLDKVNDSTLLQRIADRAFEDVISSKKYSFDNWIKSFDRNVSELLSKSGSDYVLKSKHLKVGGDLFPRRRSHARLPKFLQNTWELTPERIRVSCRPHAIKLWSFFDKVV
ncbi:MAG: hypothetical protein GWP33_00510 [Alphaproteobacteria bacterium]|nr:hypothetical protein [Alphaproteobacteria bacterium]